MRSDGIKWTEVLSQSTVLPACQAGNCRLRGRGYARWTCSQAIKMVMAKFLQKQFTWGIENFPHEESTAVGEPGRSYFG